MATDDLANKADNKPTAQSIEDELIGPLPKSLSVPQFLQILTVLKLGGTLADAAALAGFNPTTLKNWLERGFQLAMSGATWKDIPITDTESHGIAASIHFYEQVLKAKSAGKLRLLRKINRSVDAGNWKAAAFLLERLYPKEFGKKDTLTIKGDSHDPVRVAMDMTPEMRHARRVELENMRQLTGNAGQTADTVEFEPVQGENRPEPATEENQEGDEE